MKNPDFQTPRLHGKKIPKPNDIKLDVGGYVGDITHMQTLVSLPIRKAGLHMHEIAYF